MMVRLVKEFPESRVAPLIREKLREHITEGTMEGELEYFAQSRTFERPYGWAWLLLLHAELASWDDPEAEVWSSRMAPLADTLGERLGDYLVELEEPSPLGGPTRTRPSRSRRAFRRWSWPRTDPSMRPSGMPPSACSPRTPSATSPTSPAGRTFCRPVWRKRR